jgi:hypothetical protein
MASNRDYEISYGSSSDFYLVGDVEYHRSNFTVTQQLPAHWHEVGMSYRADMYRCLDEIFPQAASDCIMSYLKTFCYETVFYALYRNNIANWEPVLHCRPMTPHEVLCYLERNMYINFRLCNANAVQRVCKGSMDEIFICLYDQDIFVPSTGWEILHDSEPEVQIHGVEDVPFENTMRYHWVMEILMEHFGHNGLMKSPFVPHKANLTRTNYEVMMIALKRASEKYLLKPIYWRVDPIRLNRVRRLEEEVIEPKEAAMCLIPELDLHYYPQYDETDRYVEIKEIEVRIEKVIHTEKMEAEWEAMCRKTKEYEEKVEQQKREEEQATLTEAAGHVSSEEEWSEEEIIEEPPKPKGAWAKKYGMTSYLLASIADDVSIYKRKPKTAPRDVVIEVINPPIKKEEKAVEPASSTMVVEEKAVEPASSTMVVRPEIPGVYHGPINKIMREVKTETVKTRMHDRWSEEKKRSIQEGWQATVNLNMSNILAVQTACDYHHNLDMRRKKARQRTTKGKGVTFGFMDHDTIVAKKGWLKRGPKKTKARKRIKEGVGEFISLAKVKPNEWTKAFSHVKKSFPDGVSEDLVKKFTMRTLFNTATRILAHRSFSLCTHEYMIQTLVRIQAGLSTRKPNEFNMSRGFRAELRRILHEFIA